MKIIICYGPSPSPKRSREGGRELVSLSESGDLLLDDDNPPNGLGKLNSDKLKEEKLLKDE